MKGNVSGYTHTKQQLDSYSNQINPNNNANKAARDNRANQLNPNNFRYNASRDKRK